jgi:soluble lytic murein transglycosylase-like protein
LELINELKPYEEFIKDSADRHQVDPALVGAIIMQESSGNPMSYRFEKRCGFLVAPKVYAQKLNISLDTEINFQACSWGLMQVMGFRCRELKFDGHLPTLLSDPKLAVEMGVQALKGHSYKYLDDWIAAYNAGGPRLIAGRYVNQEYVDKVKDWMTKVMVG